MVIFALPSKLKSPDLKVDGQIGPKELNQSEGEDVYRAGKGRTGEHHNMHKNRAQLNT